MVNEFKVPFVNLKMQHSFLRKDLNNAFDKVINDSSFIQGKEVKSFEDNFCRVFDVENCISCANGTDALYISLKSLNLKPEDEVITTALSWISTSEAISHAGGKITFCDIDENSFCINTDLIESLVNKNTVGILPVHIYGQPCEMNKIKEIAKKYNLWIIEDCAQAHLAKYQKSFVGNHGIASTFSFYPSKNLGAIGDAGCISTSNDEMAKWMRSFSNHGRKNIHEIEGINSRLDGLQASILNVKIKYLKEWTKRRIKLANYYIKNLQGVGDLILPIKQKNTEHVYHLFTIRTKKRDELNEFLRNNGIGTSINYPKPLPLLECYKSRFTNSENFSVALKVCREILSIPIYPELTEKLQNHVIETIKNFYKNNS